MDMVLPGARHLQSLPARLLGWWRAAPVLRAGVLYAFVCLAWAEITQSWHSAGQVALDLGCGVTAYLLMRWLAARRGARFHTWQVVLTAWVLVSFQSVLLERPLARNPARFAVPAAPATNLAALGVRWPDQRIGMALSGGGYRAAVYHAGVLYELEQLGIRPTNLSAVSGGALIGSFYAAGGRPEDYFTAVDSGRFNAWRQLSLMHNALRLVFPAQVPFTRVRLLPFYDFSRLDVQSGLVRRMLLDGVDDVEFATCNGCPRLLLASTDLRYGVMVGMLDAGALLPDFPGIGIDRQPLSRVVLPWDASFPLAERVATSGAFPGAFPPRMVGVPVPERFRMPLDLPETAEDHLRFLLVDGGLADNTGVQLLEAASRAASAPLEGLGEVLLPPDVQQVPVAWRLDAMIVSNAGAPFQAADRLDGLAALKRAVEVIDQRGAPAHRCYPAGDNPPRVVLSPNCVRGFLDRLRVSPGPARAGLSGAPFAYPTPILTTLPELMAGDARREAAHSAIADLIAARDEMLVAADAERTLHRVIPGVRGVDPRTCARTGPAFDRIVCADVRLRQALLDDLAETLEFFRSTSTLDDQLEHERADALFRLARLQVLLSWPELRRTLLHEPPIEGGQGAAIVHGLRLPIGIGRTVEGGTQADGL